ncbi:hypothetical protein L0665_05670 [Methanogenium marinum]|uniref:Uncharacterized protein n=1 Tax=Methanogenium marinum TaxID=348610 RepID=A0A9Q4PVJ7_9EURY|nr:hypothetical protein [Methanogenium marinum]MDE4908095.1 hypothetical protein [Methanogenium marinum]
MTSGSSPPGLIREDMRCPKDRGRGESEGRTGDAGKDAHRDVDQKDPVPGEHLGDDFHGEGFLFCIKRLFRLIFEDCFWGMKYYSNKSVKKEQVQEMATRLPVLIFYQTKTESNESEMR